MPKRSTLPSPSWSLAILILCLTLLYAAGPALAEEPADNSDGEHRPSSGLDLRLPFPAGAGAVIGGYNFGSHIGGDTYAIDMCAGEDCIQSQVGDLIIAPADMALAQSVRGYGNTRYDDYHIFQLLTDGPETLCLSLAHFSLDLPNLGNGAVIQQGTALGRVGPYRDSVPHIHVGLWQVPDGCSCARYERTPRAFVGELALDGYEWPVRVEPRERLVSTNVAHAIDALSDSSAVTRVSVARRVADDADFVGDVSVPDGSLLAPGQLFRKTWRLKNIGTTTWTPDYRLAHIDGQRFEGSRTVSLPWDVAPGQEIELSASLVAPETVGSWRGDWRLLDAAGYLFGDSVWVIIETIAEPPSPETLRAIY